MSIRRLLLPFTLAAALAACHGPGSAQLRVVGVQQYAPEASTVQLQVVNRTKKAMRLQRLEYTFAGAGHEVALGAREIPPGAAAVVEVHLDEATPSGKLEGKLICELDQIIQSFPVTADL